MKTFEEIINEYNEDGLKTVIEFINEEGEILGHYVKHNKTGDIKLFSNRKRATIYGDKADIKHGAIITSKGIYYKDPERNVTPLQKAAFDLHNKNVKEEATEDEFNKQLETDIKKNSGKIRNKNIAKPASQGVVIQKEEFEEYLHEHESVRVTINGKQYYKDDEGNITPVGSKSGNIVKGFMKSKYNRGYGLPKPSTDKYKEPLSSEQAKRKLEIMDDLHKNIDKFKEKYGERAHIVIHGIADKMVRSGIKEDLDIIIERELTSSEEDKKESVVKSMKKNLKDFKARYGDRAKDVMYATATKIAKEDAEISEEDQLDEWNAVGFSHAKAKKWLGNNGYEYSRDGRHAIYKHKDTGESVTTWNHHDKEVSPKDLRNARLVIRDHHKKHGFPYTEI